MTLPFLPIFEHQEAYLLVFRTNTDAVWCLQTFLHCNYVGVLQKVKCHILIQLVVLTLLTSEKLSHHCVSVLSSTATWNLLVK